MSSGKLQDLNRHPGGDKQISGTYGGFGPCSIGIVKNGGTVGVAFQEEGLIGGQSGAHGGYGVADPVLIQGEQVHIAFHQQRKTAPADSPAVLIQTVEFFSLVVKRVLRGVDVFGIIVVGTIDPSPEGDHLSGQIEQREHEAVPKNIVEGALAAAGEETAFQKNLRRDLGGT